MASILPGPARPHSTVTAMSEGGLWEGDPEWLDENEKLRAALSTD
ncbi:hypothetical protein AB0O90_13430 [Microbacterium testaceum]